MRTIFTRICAGAFLLHFLTSSSCNAQQWQWAFKTERFDIKKTALADDGSAYVIGNFQDSCLFDGTVIHGASSPDNTSLLCKIDQQGILSWYKKITGNAEFSCLGTIGNDVIVAGNFRHMSGFFNDIAADDEIFIARVSPSGSLIHYKREGGAGNQSLTDLVVESNKIIISGNFYPNAVLSGNTLTGAGYITAFFARYDENLNIELAKQILEKENSYGPMLKTDAAGNIYLSGFYADTITFGNNDTTVYFQPYSMETQVIKMNAAGKYRRIYLHLGNYGVFLRNFSSFQNGNYLLFLNDDYGCNHCCSGIILSKTDTGNNILWQKKYGAGGVYSGDPQCMAVGDLVTTDSSLLCATFYTGDMKIGNDSIHGKGMCLFKTDHAGNFTYVKTFPYFIAPDRFSNQNNTSVLLSGHFEGEAYLDNLALHGGTYHTKFVAKYNDVAYPLSVPQVAKQNSIHIFPNPSPGEFYLDGIRSSCEIKIYSPQGNEVKIIPIGSQQ
ncbi:MAG TPA: hypothetical protein VI112_09750, partial [Bacteroidia bacterium]